MFKTVQLGSERFKSWSLELVDEYSRVRNFQNQSTQQSVFLNRLSGVRLSPGPPLLPIHFHRVDSSRSNSKHALKQCGVIKVSYFFACDLPSRFGTVCGRTFPEDQTHHRCIVAWPHWVQKCAPGGIRCPFRQRVSLAFSFVAEYRIASAAR